MQCVFAILRAARTGFQCAVYCLRDRSDRHKRAACVAIALGPIRIKLEQSLKGVGRFLVAAAIAEQPDRKVEYFRIAAGQAESPPTTLQRLLAVAAVEQRLGYARRRWS